MFPLDLSEEIKMKNSIKMKTIKLSNGIVVQAKVIEDIDTYRGFYVLLSDGTYVVASFNSNGLEMGYRNGFNTENKSVVQYLYEKLSKNEKLSKHEKSAFYEKVDLFNPVARNMGITYNFSAVLNKVFGIEFYTLERKLSKFERERFYEHSLSSLVDLELLAKAA